MSKVEKFKTALQEAEQEHKREQDRVRKAREDLEKVQARLGEVDPDNATEFQRFTSERTIATDRLESFGLRERIASEKVERAKQALAEAVAAERVAAAKAARQLVARAAVHLSALAAETRTKLSEEYRDFVTLV